MVLAAAFGLGLALATAEAWAADLVSPKGLSTPPVPYPEGGRGDAEVLLELEIAKDGRVVAANLRSGRNPFARAALKAALNWRFTPARQNGVAVQGRVSTLVMFRDPVPIIPALNPLARAPGGGAESSILQNPDLGAEGLDLQLGEELEEVVVHSEGRSEIGGTSVPYTEARQIPGTFGDPFRVAEVLPGVAPIMSGLPYFFMRGAPPGSVGYFVDGIRIPLLFHVGPGPSIMAPSLIDRVDVIPSAYSVRFGRAAGGLIIADTAPASGVARAEAQARFFDTSAIAEVPIGDSGLSVLAGGRYSYFQPLLDRVSPEYALNYWDYQARVNYQPDPTDLVSVFAFGASDKLRNRRISRQLLDINFHRLDVRWEHSSPTSSTRIAITGSADSAQNAEEESIIAESRVASRGVRLRASTSLRVARGVTVRLGGDGGFDEISNEQSLQGAEVLRVPDRTDLSGSLYADTSLEGPGVELVPGLRLEAAKWRGGEYWYPEPRLASRVKLGGSVAWVSQLGVTHQFPTQNVRIPGLVVEPIETYIRTAWQAAQGIEFGSASILAGKVTAFHSWTEADDSELHGRSYGIETFLRRDFGEGFGGILSYTLSRTRTIAGRLVIPSEFDRTHVISAILGWNLGAGVRVGVRGYYATGQYYTATCPTADCGPADPLAPRTFTVRGRLPDFFRADLRLEKRWELGSTGWIGVTFEWFNATLSSETVFAEWSALEGRIVPSDRDPLHFPSLGVEAGF